MSELISLFPQTLLLPPPTFPVSGRAPSVHPVMWPDDSIPPLTPYGPVASTPVLPLRPLGLAQVPRSTPGPRPHLHPGLPSSTLSPPVPQLLASEGLSRHSEPTPPPPCSWHFQGRLPITPEQTSLEPPLPGRQALHPVPLPKGHWTLDAPGNSPSGVGSPLISSLHNPLPFIMEPVKSSV